VGLIDGCSRLAVALTHESAFLMETSAYGEALMAHSLALPKLDLTEREIVWPEPQTLANANATSRAHAFDSLLKRERARHSFQGRTRVQEEEEDGRKQMNSPFKCGRLRRHRGAFCTAYK
jgi:hypothetical protein